VIRAAIVRLFVAINLPPLVRRTISAATASMREAAGAISWVPEDRLHLTMEFLGEQPASAVPELKAALCAAAERHAPVALALRGFGAFPNLRAPRIVWLGVEPDPKLELLQHDLASVCNKLGYERDARAFRPHITLGRARTRLKAEAARALATAARAVAYAGVVEVETVDLMESRLLPSGARYSVVAAMPLGRG
jgi:RNA 2',3'-cyclic 3'-phosphodiesterase